MQEIKDYLSVYNEKEPISKFTKFLWWCAGADKQLLELSPMTDRVKFAGIGGLVLCTGLLGFCSGGYAFYTIFSPKGGTINPDITHVPTAIGSIVGGLIWGLVIFNMDRFIISSTSKGDGTYKMAKSELINAIPRVLIALILGFALSAPLETRILKTEIEQELNERKLDRENELNTKTDLNIQLKQKNLMVELSKNTNDINTIEAEKEKRRIEIAALTNKIQEEIAGRSGSGKAGVGPTVIRETEDLATQKSDFTEFKTLKEPELKLLKRKKAQNEFLIQDLETQKQKEYISNKDSASKLDGLMERIKISHDVGGWIPWIIFLVLLSIEMGPIFFKMMVQDGVYDYLVENNKKRFKAQNGIIISNDLVHGKDGAISAKKVDFLEVEKEIEAKKKQLDKQADLTSKVIDNWHEKKKGEIDQNPENFYTES